MFSIRMKTVRLVNKIRGVETKELKRLRFEACITSGSMALHLGVSFIKYFDWEEEYAVMPKAQFEKAVQYLHDRMKEQERAASDAARNFGYRAEVTNRDESGVKIDV